MKTHLKETCERCVTQEQAENTMRLRYAATQMNSLERTTFGTLVDNYEYERRKVKESLAVIDHIMRQIGEILNGVGGRCKQSN